MSAAARSSASRDARPARVRLAQRAGPAIADREVVHRRRDEHRGAVLDQVAGDRGEVAPARRRARRRSGRPTRSAASGSCCPRTPSAGGTPPREAHSMNRHASSLRSDRAFMTSDHVHRFGRTSRARGRRRVADPADQARVLLVLEEGDVVVGVDDQPVGAAGEVERELVPALLEPVRRPRHAQRRRRTSRSPPRPPATAIAQRPCVVEVAPAGRPHLRGVARVHRVPHLQAALAEAAHASRPPAAPATSSK